MTIIEGWDSHAWIDGPWIHRSPKRDEVRPRLLAEATLLPWLAPQLPLPIPTPERTQDGVRHLLLAGEPLERGSVSLGRELGHFLKRLHSVDPAEAVTHGAQHPTAGAEDHQTFIDKCRAQVLPLLPTHAQPAAAELLDRVGRGGRTSLIHSDLGPEHLLVTDGRLTGVIDWTDAEIGDPALDLSWLLNDAPPGIAEGVVEAYGLGPELGDRARDWHRLAPWYEVGYGLVTDQPAYVETGIAGVLKRL